LNKGEYRDPWTNLLADDSAKVPIDVGAFPLWLLNSWRTPACFTPTPRREKKEEVCGSADAERRGSIPQKKKKLQILSLISNFSQIFYLKI